MKELKLYSNYTAIVKRIVSNGLLVEIEGYNITSVVDTREVSFPEGTFTTLKQFRKGQKVQVRVIGIRESREKDKLLFPDRYILSIRLVDNDPWDNIQEALKWAPKKPYTFQVDRVTKSHAKGEVIPGVTALVDFDRLNSFFDEINVRTLMDRLPKPGDYLAGYIDLNSADKTSRTVSMDIISYIKDIRRRTACDGQLPVIHPPSFQKKEFPQYKKRAASFSNILVVDDEVPLCNIFKGFLESGGYIVHAASSIEEARQIMDKSIIHLMVMDMQIPSLTEGYELLESVASLHPQIKIILITGDLNFPYNRDTTPINSIKIVNFIAKPFTREDLLDVVAESEMIPPVAFTDFFKIINREEAVELKSEKEIDNFTTLEESLFSRLNALVDKTKAGAGAVFKMHPVSLEVDMTASVNIDENVFFKVRQRLSMSPVKDCAVEHEVIHTNTAHHKEEQGKHLYLRQLIEYDACILVPIPVKDKFAYCLFLCNRGIPFTLEDKHDAEKAAGELVRLYLEHFRLEQALKTTSEANIAVNYAMLGHELNTKLIVMQAMISGLDSYLVTDEMYQNIPVKIEGERFVKDIINIIPDKDKNFISSFYIKNNNKQEYTLQDIISNTDRDKIAVILTRVGFSLRKKTDELGREIKRVFDITTLFKNMAVKEKESEVRIETLLESVRTDILSYAKAEGYKTDIKIENTLKSIPVIYAREREIFQLFFNIVLNCIQHSFLFVPPVVIPVTIGISENAIEEKDYIIIDIKDIGPGIHTVDFESIFEPFVTNKPGGAGLGLYLSKRILKQNGGDIFVKESVLYVGTTFRILLPL